MELRYLKAFLELAEELHFQRAARHLGITQPTLSHQIKTLEEELGVTLFARDRSGVDLTPAGVAFQNSIEPLLENLQRAIDEVREIENGRSKEIRIATGDYLNVKSINRSVAKLRAAYPDWSIEIRHLPTTETFPAVKEKEVDVGFGPLPVTHPALIAKTVIKGYWEAVLPADHKLGDNEVIELKQLKRQPLIIFDKALNPKLYSAWMQRFEGAGFSPRIVYETRQIQTGLQMTDELGAVYVIASYLLPNRLEGLIRRPLSGFENQIAVGATWREDNESSALAEYLKILRKEIEDSER